MSACSRTLGPIRSWTLIELLGVRCGGFLPILPRSPAILSKAGFDSIVLDGAMTKTGMVSFKRYLTPEQVEDIRAYLLWRAETDPVAPAPQGAVTKAAAASGAHAQ
jgi:mono/diheme cytochrome c family protein